MTGRVARSGDPTPFTFSYLSTPADAAVGAIAFEAVVTIVGAHDAVPGDNRVVSCPTVVRRPSSRTAPGNGEWNAILSKTAAFNFEVAAARFEGSELSGLDSAPDGGMWRYEFALKQCANRRDDDGDGKVDTNDLGCAGAEDDLESDDPFTLSIDRPTVAPATAKAGRPVVVRVAVKQLETNVAISRRPRRRDSASAPSEPGEQGALRERPRQAPAPVRRRRRAPPRRLRFRGGAARAHTATLAPSRGRRRGHRRRTAGCGARP